MLQIVRDGQQDARGERERHVEACENRHDLGEDEHREHRGYTQSRDGDKQRIHQGATHFALERVLFGELVGKVVEVLAQDPARFAHTDEVDGKIAKEP